MQEEEIKKRQEQIKVLKKKKEKGTLIKNTFIVFILFTIISIFVIITLYTNKIELTQLKNSTDKQMMGYVIKAKNDTLIVIDGGTEEDAENLEQIINDNGGKVDYWFITHPHIDHMGAFVKIAKNTDIEIGKVYVTYNDLSWYQEYANERPNEAEYVEEFLNVLQLEKIQGKVEKVTLSEKFNIQNIKVQILGIANEEITTNAANNSSMIIKMEVNDKSILFLGDTGEESGEKLLKNQGNNIKADIVQMAHHGQDGVSEKIYKIINPKICLWPTPEWLWNNDSGEGIDSGSWKTLETRDWINKLNVSQNIIEKDGNQTITVW